MIIEAIFTACVIVAGSPCEPCEIPVAAQGTPVVRCMPVSREFVEEAKVRIVPCEGGWNWDAVGAAKELGPLQIHPIHGAETEEARWRKGNQLWREKGFAPWTGADNPKCKEEP